MPPLDPTYVHQLHDSPLSITHCTWWILGLCNWSLAEGLVPQGFVWIRRIWDTLCTFVSCLSVWLTTLIWYHLHGFMYLLPAYSSDWFSSYSPFCSLLSSQFSSCFPLLCFVCSLFFFPPLWCSACPARGAGPRMPHGPHSQGGRALLASSTHWHWALPGVFWNMDFLNWHSLSCTRTLLYC